MKTQIEILENPFDKITTKDDFQNKCKEIAKELIYNFCIDCGTKKYRFAEIEFYYYNGNKSQFREEWNEKTYARNNKKAGDLFFHYSGVDICFKSDFKERTFGGILIRSLVEKMDNGKERYITGPLLCVNEILNSCAPKETWPIIKRADKRECNIGKTNRYGIKYKKDPNFEDGLCFYDKNLELESMTATKFKGISWNFKSAAPKDLQRNYKRFAYKHLANDIKNEN